MKNHMVYVHFFIVKELSFVLSHVLMEYNKHSKSAKNKERIFKYIFPRGTANIFILFRRHCY